MQKHALMIAYHFPPIQGSSGLLRTVAFSRYLQDFGWTPIVLAPHQRAYPSAADSLSDGVPDGVLVKRTFALDSARHLSFRGSYWRATAMPDRWITWWPAAIYNGLKLIRQYKPSVIWSTYPIPTAHLIAYTLSKITNIPWVADFRDPMVYENWPERKAQRWMSGRIERAAINASDVAVCTTASTLQLYRDRYPQRSDQHWAVIPNGYDETAFSALHATDPAGRAEGAPVSLLHSGLMEPTDRNPRYLFEAIASLIASGEITENDLKLTLRATGGDELYAEIIRELSLEKVVSLASHIPYNQALEEMLAADGLLLFQGPNCNRQIPAKLYEYFRIGKPIFAMTDERGDTANLLKSVGVEAITPYDSVSNISSALLRFIRSIRAGTALGVPLQTANEYSRARGAESLAEVFERIT